MNYNFLQPPNFRENRGKEENKYLLNNIERKKKQKQNRNNAKINRILDNSYYRSQSGKPKYNQRVHYSKLLKEEPYPSGCTVFKYGEEQDARALIPFLNNNFITPKEGKLVVFPNNLNHYTIPFHNPNKAHPAQSSPACGGHSSRHEDAAGSSTAK